MKKATQATLGAALTMGALAGAYYLYGSKDAVKHRKKLASWAGKAEKEVIAQAKKMKTAAMTDANMKLVIGEVAKRYEAAKGVEPQDVRDFITSAQKSWKAAASAMKKQSASVKKGAKSVVKKAKKAVKKRS